MIYLYKSEEAFRQRATTEEALNDGDILTPKWLNSLGGVSASDTVAIIIDNSLGIDEYRVVDEDGSVELRDF